MGPSWDHLEASWGHLCVSWPLSAPPGGADDIVNYEVFGTSSYLGHLRAGHGLTTNKKRKRNHENSNRNHENPKHNHEHVRKHHHKNKDTGANRREQEGSGESLLSVHAAPAYDGSAHDGTSINYTIIITGCRVGLGVIDRIHIMGRLNYKHSGRIDPW